MIFLNFFRRIGILFFLLSLLFSRTALAEVTLKFATPMPGSSISFAPGNFMLSFSEPVVFTKTRVRVTGPDKQAVDLSALSQYQDNILARFNGDMGYGIYIVTWETVSAEGEAAAGSYRFTIKK